MNAFFQAIALLFFLLPPPLAGQEFVLEKLPESINSGFDEITPVPSRDGNTLYFTRVGSPEFDRTLFLDQQNLAEKLSPESYRAELGAIFGAIGNTVVTTPETSAFNQDVWVAQGDSGKFGSVFHPGFPLNNALPNSLVAITPDPNGFYVINQFRPEGGMKKGFSMIRQMADGVSWSFPQPVEIRDYYTITSDVSLTMSFDGQILILSAARQDSREMDLYVCFREGEQKWSTPQHLGPSINSEKRETTPFLSEDNQTLFFSSNRENSSGGNDIFMARRLDDTWKNWSSPLRLSEPINSTADDSQPYFNMTSGYLYFSSRRDGNGSDIFRVQIAPPQPTEITLRGRILNGQTGELVRLATIQYSMEGMQNTLEIADGQYALKIPKGIRFELTPAKPGYIGHPDTAFFRRDYYFFQDYYILDLVVEPLSVNSKIELKPIFFQQSKAAILESSFSELERLASILAENPRLAIRIEGHTDNNGKEVELLRLSEQRAEALKTFLLGKGISPERIETVGFGSKSPLNDNSIDPLRKQNRRVEIRIIKV